MGIFKNLLPAKQASKGALCSIQIFINDNGVIDFIPSFYTSTGAVREIDIYREITPPHTFEKIGGEFLRMWEEAKRQPLIEEEAGPLPMTAYRIISGKERYADFQALRQMIRAEFGGNKLKLQYRYQRCGGYGMVKGDKKIGKTLRLPADASAVGEAVDQIYYEVNGRHVVSELYYHF